MTELQSFGLRLADPGAGAASRRGGAGPSDHKAVTVDGHTIMVPVHTGSAFESPFSAEQLQRIGRPQKQIAKREHLHAHPVPFQPFADQQEHRAETQQMYAKHAKNDGSNHGVEMGERGGPGVTASGNC